MDADTLHLLQSSDDPVHCENPPDHRWDAALERVRPLKAKLEQITGRSFDIDEHVQDASFFTDLSVHVPGEKPNYIDTVLAVRFSSFGDPFTVWSQATEQLPPGLIQKIIATVRAEGFHYVDEGSLAEAYSGANPVFAGGTWGYRFFDYI